MRKQVRCSPIGGRRSVTSPRHGARDGQLLAVGGVGGEDPLVYVWNARRNALQSVLQGHAGMVVHVMFGHSGYLVATVVTGRPGSGMAIRENRWQ